MAGTNNNHMTEEQLALDQTLSSQELNLVDQQVLAENAIVKDNNEKVPGSPDDKELKRNTQQFNLSDDDFNNALANMDLKVEKTNNPTSNHASSVEKQQSTNTSAVSEETTTSKNNKINVELQTDIPSCSKSDPRLDDLSTRLKQLNIQTTDKKPTTVISDQELAAFSNDKAWKNLVENGSYKIFAFTVLYKNVLHSHVGILAQEKNSYIKRVYRLNDQYKDRFIACYKNLEQLKKEGYTIENNIRSKIIYLTSGNSFAEFKTKGTDINEEETCPDLEDIVFHTPEWENAEMRIKMNKENSSNVALQNNKTNVPKTDNIPGPSITTESEPQVVESTSSKQSVKIANEVQPREPTRAIGISIEKLALFSSKWKDLDNIAGTYEIFAFTWKLERGISKIGILAKNKRFNFKDVYYMKGAYEKHFKYFFDHFGLLAIEGYLKTPYKRLYIVRRVELQSIAKFTIKGTEKFEGRICPRYENFEFHTSSWNNYESYFGMSQKKLLRSFFRDNWVDRVFDPFSEYTVYAFTYDNPAVGVLASQMNSDSKQVYIFKGPGEEEFIQRYDNRHSSKELYGVVSNNNSDVMFLKSRESMAKLKTGKMTSDKGHPFPDVIDLHFSDESTTDQNTELIFGETKEKLSCLFDLENQNQQLDRTGKYKVYAFTVTGNERFSRVLVLAKKRNAKSKKVFCIEGSSSEKFQVLFSTKAKGFPQYKMMKLNSIEIMYLATEQPIATFETNGVAFENNRRIPKIENLDFPST